MRVGLVGEAMSCVVLFIGSGRETRWREEALEVPGGSWLSALPRNDVQIWRRVLRM